MSEFSKLSLDDMRANAEKLVQSGNEIREKLRALTLQALTQGELAENEIRAALGAIAEGVSKGAGQRAEVVKSALNEALGGMDDALSHAAEAMHLAIGEVAADAKTFHEQELKKSIDELKKLESLFLETLGRVADGASGLVKQEMQAVAEHGRRIGTDTGGRVRVVAEELSQRVKSAAHGAADAGKDAAREAAAKVAARASQKLGEIAGRLAQKAEQLKQDKP